MERVLAMEPWHFNKQVLMLNPITAAVQPSLIQFNKAPFWIRLYDIPMIGREKEVLQKIGNRIGNFIEMDDTTVGGLARSVRMKVTVDLEKPIKRGTKIKIGSNATCWIPITYERLPSFCYWCGKLGHTHKDCEQLLDKEEQEGNIDENQMPYGDWMRSSPMKSNQMVAERNTDTRDSLRRSLFTANTSKADRHQDVTDTGPKNTGCPSNNSRQILDLMTSLEKVEVGQKISPQCKAETSLQKSTSHQKTHHPTAPLLPSKVLNTNTTYTNTPCSQNNPSKSTTPNTPPTQLLPNKPKPSQIPSMPINISSTNPKPIHTPYTLTPVLIDMVKRQCSTLQKNHMDHQPKHPPIPTEKPNTLLKIKTEPISPLRSTEPKSGVKPSHPKVWKRRPSNHQSKGGSPILKREKRKDDLMEVDLTYLGDHKRTKNDTGEHSMVMAAADEQPRQSS